jgi:hypothetical protein
MIDTYPAQVWPGSVVTIQALHVIGGNETLEFAEYPGYLFQAKLFKLAS